jgi:XTP/dITP diphosphohydrolase
MDFYFITSNKNKTKEIEEVLGTELKILDLRVREIQEIDVEKVVKDKAKEAFSFLKRPVIVEDTGLYIKAWNKFPGALIKWVLKGIGGEGICKFLKNERRAIAETCFCYYDGKKPKVFKGQIKGEIAKKPKGKSGFGWDPIFQPKGFKKTFAEMSLEEKTRISMRTKALNKLIKFLKKNRV